MANYLAGTATAELGQYSAAQAYFDAAYRSYKKSRSALLMARYCERMGKIKTPSDEQRIAAFDAAFDEAWKHLKLKKPEGLAGVFELHPFLKDPLLLRIELEAVEEGGSLHLDPKVVSRAALDLDETDALFLAAYWLGGDADTAVFDRLENEKHAARLEQLEYLSSRFGEVDATAEDTSEFTGRAADFSRTNPEDGLWYLLQISEKPPEGDRLEPPPLTLDELKLVEGALTAKRLSFPPIELSHSARVLLKKSRFPYVERVADTNRSYPFTVLPFFRKALFKRLSALAQAAHDDSDPDLADRATRAMKSLAERILRDISRQPSPTIVHVLAEAWRNDACIARLRYGRLSPVEWITEQEKRVGLQANRWNRTRTVSYAQAAEGMLNCALVRASSGCSDGELLPWERLRASRIMNDPHEIAEDESYLKSIHALGREPRFDDIVRAGVFKQTALRGIFRDFVPLSEVDDTRWALVWAAGELQDEAQIPWLLECLTDENRLWMPMAAEDALKKITGKDGGRNPAAWRRVLGLDP